MLRPNIVFIQADQLAARQLNCYGSGISSSPVLDRLAREGMRFDRCYATFPLCLPNRATMLTGRSPGIHGLINGRTKLLADHPSYAQMLGPAGYRVGGFGKFHREGTSSPHPRTLKDLGFDAWTIVEDDKRGPYLEWIRTEHPEYYELALGRLGKWKGHLTPEQEAGRERARAEVFRPLFDRMQYVHMFPSPFPPEVHDTTYITDLALDFMGQHIADRAEQPFVCQVSYVDPHDPYDPPEPYDAMFRAEELPEPVPAEWPEQGPRCLEAFNALNCKVIREQNPGVFRTAKALYHGSIRFMDDQIGRLIQFLEEHGLVNNTVVLFTTDHGDLMGDHGFLAKGDVHYDGCIRVPLIAWGGRTGAGACGELISSLDIVPTLCDLAGVPEEERPPLEGKSFAAACEGRSISDGWEEVAVWGSGAQTVVTDDGWRLTLLSEHGEGQMFNLREDPQEQRNLYNDAGPAGKRQELLERMVGVTVRPFRIPRFANAKH